VKESFTKIQAANAQRLLGKSAAVAADIIMIALRAMAQEK
jgi:hypothetical protein